MCLHPGKEHVAEKIEDNPENAPAIGLVLDARAEDRARAAEAHWQELREQQARQNAALQAFMAALREDAARRAEQADDNGRVQGGVVEAGGMVEGIALSDDDEEINGEEEVENEGEEEEQNQEEEEEEETAV